MTILPLTMESRGFGSCFCCLCGRQPDRFVQGRRSSLVTSVLFCSVLQYEGAVKEDGRGKTTWDTFAHTFGICFGFSLSLSVSLSDPTAFHACT